MLSPERPHLYIYLNSHQTTWPFSQPFEQYHRSSNTNNSGTGFFVGFRADDVTRQVIERNGIRSYYNAMKTTHFRNGEEFPETEPGKLRLYSMRFCPYAERALLTAALKGIPHEIVNINLKDKPQWFLNRSVDGTVPVAERDGKLVGGSLIVSEFLDEAYPEECIRATDAYGRAQERMFIERFTKVGNLFFSHFGALLDGDSSKSEEIFKALEWVEEDLLKKGTVFFAGPKLGLVDLMIWPWVERIEALSPVPLPLDQLPTLIAWVARLREHPVIQKTCQEPHLIKKFFSDWRNGKPEYDM